MLIMHSQNSLSTAMAYKMMVKNKTIYYSTNVFKSELLYYTRGGSTYGPNQHQPPFWQIMQIQPIFGYFGAIFRLHQPPGPPLGSRPPFFHILDPPLYYTLTLHIYTENIEETGEATELIWFQLIL